MYAELKRNAAVPLNDAELRQLTAFAHRLADASGEVIRPYFRSDLAVDNKLGEGGFDPVTLADQAAEQAIRELIAAERPQDSILGEEHGYEIGDSGLTWVIDPIDGTRAFITGMPLWGTLIALHDGQQPVLGVMDQPYLGERFTGSRLGVQLDSRAGSKALSTRACAQLSTAVLQCTSRDMFKAGVESEAFEAVASQVRLSRFSGDCYAYCMLAHGLIDLVIEADLKPYDIQALIPIVEAAGGVVTAWDGGSAALGGQIVAAGDPVLHAQALALLAPAANQGSIRGE